MADPTDIATKETLQRITWTLNRAQRAVVRAKEPGFEAATIPRSHYDLLMYAYSFPANSGAELARRMGVTTQAVAVVAAKLEERGLLERRVHPRHQTVREIHLTDAGLEVLRRAEQVVLGVEGRVLDALGPRDAETLRLLLEAVIDAVAEPATSQLEGGARRADRRPAG